VRGLHVAMRRRRRSHPEVGPLPEKVRSGKAASESVAEILATMEDEVLENIRTGGDSEMGALSTAAREFGGHSGRSTMHSLVRQNAQKIAAANPARRLSFPMFGNSKAAFLPRFLAMWTIVLPFLILRALVTLFLFASSMGIIAPYVVAGTAGPIAGQAYYRDVMEWAQEDDTFQAVWNTMAEIFAFMFNVMLWCLRLLLEIWNGFCPLIALLIDIVYDVLRQLAVMWYAAPVLQYIGMWLVRFVVYTIETFLDALVSIAEAFAQFAEDMTVNLANAVIQEGEEQFEDLDVGRRRLFSSGGGVEVVGDVLLFICVSIATLIIRVTEALVVAFLPLIYSFLRLVLPKILKYIPPLIQLGAKFVGLFTSDPVKRIVNYIIQAVPLFVEIFGSYLCAIVIYLGSAFCYLIYIVCVTISFFLRYVVRPLICSGNAILAGCFRAFVRASMNGDECYSCAGYHTACGCDPRNSAPAHGGCDGDTCTGGDGVAHPYTPPVPPPPVTTRNATRGVPESDEFVNFAANPATLRDMGSEYNAQQADQTSAAQIGVTNIATEYTQMANTFETEVNGQRCGVYGADSTDCDPGATRATTYAIAEPATVRRRRTDITTAGVLPPGVAPLNSTPYTEAPTVAPTHRKTEVTTTQTKTSVSYDAVVTASAGLYAGISQHTGTKAGGIVEWFRMGSMSYRYTDGETKCPHGTDTNSPECQLSAMRYDLAEFQTSVPKAVNAPASTWMFSDWGAPAWIHMRLAISANVTEVTMTWMIDGSVVRGPSSLVVRVSSVGGSFVEQAMSKLACGATVATERKDSVQITHSVNANSVMLSSMVPCGPDAYRSPEHDSPLILKRMIAYGPRVEYAHRRGPGVAPTDIVSFSAVPRIADVPLFLTVYPSAANGVRMWDPCASEFAVQTVDGAHDHATVFIVDNEQNSHNASLDLQLVLSHTNDDGFAQAVRREVDAIVVHFAPTVAMNMTSVWLCTEAVCVPPSMSTDTLSGYTEPHREALDETWNAVYANESSVYGAIFWEKGYADSVVYPSRGASVTFDGLLASGVGNTGNLTLRFGAGAFSHLRKTTWATLRLETGLLPEYDAASQWVYDVDNQIQPNGAISSPPNARCFPERTTHTNFPGGVAHLASYRDPFGGVSNPRQWFGITEIDAFGRAAVANSGGRRLLSGEALIPEDAAAFDDLRHRATHRANKANEQLTRGVQDEMRVVGLDAFRHSTRNHDEADSQRVHTAHTSGAPEHAMGHPFAPDLAELPETEPVFSCVPIGVGGMECKRVRQMGVEFQNTTRTTHTTKADAHTPTEQGALTPAAYTKAEIERLFDMGHKATTPSEHGMDKVIAERVTRAAWQREPHRGVATTRVPHARLLLGAVGDGIEAAFRSMISVFEEGVCAMMVCGAYCPGPDCSSDSELGECFKGFGGWIVRNMFGCSQDDSIDNCVVDKLLSGILELLDQLLDWILQIVDAFGNGIAQMLHIGDILKIIACESCAVTNIAVGVLADFTESFSLSACNDIVDIGTNQCDAFGMGDIGEIGEKVFMGYFGLLKILFGLFQVIPAIIEMQIELAIFIGQQILELFPELIGDAMDILLWFIASSDVIYTLETLFEAFDSIVTEIEEKQEIFAPSGQTPGPPPFAFADVTTNAASTKNNHTETEPVFVEQTSAGGGCVDASPADSSEDCDQSTSATNDFFDSTTSRAAMVSQTEAAQPDSRSSLSYNLGGCGCRVSRQACEDGPGAGNCPYNTGVSALRQQAKTDAAMQQTLQQDPDDTASWPHCSDVSERVVLPVGGASGPELERRYVQSRRCYVVSRKTTTGGVNDMALQSAAQAAAGSSTPSWWPFKRFSKQDGTYTSDNDPDIDLGEFEGSRYPSNDDIHRRRRSSSDRRVLHAMRASMGVAEFYSDPEDGDLPADHRTRAAQAASDMARMLAEANTTYAEHQTALLRKDARKLMAFGAETWESLKKIEYARMSRAAHATVGAARRLMAGFSGATASDVACGVTMGAVGAGGSPIHPNTYPCCKGLWCCLRPPIPRDWRFKKEWIAWHDSWTRDTQCPELRTHPDGWLFAIQAASKVGKTVSAFLVPVWPYSALVEWVWSFTNFPDGQWPQEKNHGFPKWVFHQYLCYVLNVGIYVALGVSILFLYISRDSWINFFNAHLVLYADIFAPTVAQSITLSRRARRWGSRSRAPARAASGVHDELWRDGHVLTLDLPERAATREAQALLL